MILGDTELGIHFDEVQLSLSAQRIWEHIEFRQINPFKPIPSRGHIRPEDYIDVVDTSGLGATLTGLNLAEVIGGNSPGLASHRIQQLIGLVEMRSTQNWLRRVRTFLLTVSLRRSIRNVPAPFLPHDDGSPFGIDGLHCALLCWLNDRRSEVAKAEQWLQRIRNLSAKGLREEELKVSDLERALAGYRGKMIDGNTIIHCLTYKDLRLSILPVLQYAGRQIRFSRVAAGTAVKRIKPKLKLPLQTRPQWRDQVLGYWVDAIDWDDLLGLQRGWLAFTCRGELLTSASHPRGLCRTPEQAMSLADSDAATKMPKMSTRGSWTAYRLTGGEQYREWLVTLPYYPVFYLSDHFDHRNILLHVRCDIRETERSERVLVLQEVQSDWARRATPIGSGRTTRTVAAPPWLREWPALALKLMLLHAARIGAEALAWTPGAIQLDRYQGGVGQKVIDLYDRILPKELNRLLRAYSRKCEHIDVFLPVNFRIEPADSGYVVLNENGEALGTVESWPEVQQLLPDGAHEILATMHGVRLDNALRKTLLSNGFPAWGFEIR